MLLAERDPLTGLLNKAGFETYMAKKIARDDGGALAILYIDLDHFKPINDTRGHPAGDEFVVVLAGIREAKNAAMVAEKIVKLAQEPICIGEQTVLVGASIGVACNADAQGGWKALLARADEMVYRAKAQGRGRYVLAAPEAPQVPERQLRAS